MTAAPEIGQGAGEIRRRPRFVTDTPAQLRCFRLLTLAQMVHLEDMGLGVTHKTARQQAMAELEIPNTADGRRTPTDDLIGRLRDAAVEARGLIEAEAPTKPIRPQAGA